tara:strand:+ start:136 stop:345 length:210 start_codon:yes stop_codon:yes gene_type:complete
MIIEHIKSENSVIVFTLKMAGKLDLLNTNGVIINAQNKKVPITIYHFKFKKPQINKDIQAGKVIVVIIF